MDIPEDFDEGNFEADEPEDHYQLLGMVIIIHAAYWEPRYLVRNFRDFLD